MKTQLLTSLHHETNNTMSDGEWYDGYDEHHDNDDDGHGYDSEHFEELKKEERGILHAERKVDVKDITTDEPGSVIRKAPTGESVRSIKHSCLCPHTIRSIRVGIMFS